jgi:eukaryotic-like serine/threonine-protein kinase
VIIDKMMKIDLKARYQTMGEVIDDLERYKESLKEGGDKAGRGRQAEEDEDFASIFLLPPEAAPGEREPAAAPPPAKAVPQRSILCVEAQDEIQDILRKSLTKMGYRPLLVGDSERAAERFRESPVDAVIFDADGQEPDSIEHFLDMHEKAHEDEHQLVALVLLGPRQVELREKLPTDDRLVVLSKPLKMKEVQDALRRLLPAH